MSSPRAMRVPASTTSVATKMNPANAPAWMSIVRKRSSRASPRKPPRLRCAAQEDREAERDHERERKDPLAWIPPIHCVSRKAPPRRPQKAGRNHFDLVNLVTEHLLHSRFEISRERERKRKRGDVASFLDRVDRLP